MRTGFGTAGTGGTATEYCEQTATNANAAVKNFVFILILPDQEFYDNRLEYDRL